MNASRHPLELFVRNLELRSRLGPEDRQAILDLPHTLRALDAGAYLLRESDPPRSCAVLISGFAFRQKLTGEGVRQIVALNIPGDALDLQNLFLDVSDHSVQMLTRGQVALIARADLQQIIRSHSNVGHAMLVKILTEASVLREWVLNVGRRSARARMAHLLCELAVRLDAEGLAQEYGYELPMTQEQLGDALGLTAVHVNRTLKALEADGLIARTKRNIHFPNWKRLVEAGDFNSRYLHLEPQRSGVLA
jgi:CRP-like cAMP-binding protein